MATYNVTNLITNGNFASGLTNVYTINGCNKSVSSGILSTTATTQYGGPSMRVSSLPNVGDKLYAYIETSVPYTGVNFSFIYNTGTGNLPIVEGLPTGGFKITSSIHQVNSSIPIDAGAGLYIQDIKASAWQQIQTKKIILINMTRDFGLGNEPTIAEMDKIIADNGGYWEGTKTITTGKMFVNVNGVWKNATPSVKVSGIWKPVSKGYVNVSGVWKQFY